MNDITFDEEIMRSMAQVVASQNPRSTAENEGQALFICKTKEAEAEGCCYLNWGPRLKKKLHSYVDKVWPFSANK